ncbi:transposable element Tcb2 transposase [Trichonephila clavipes]|nr:transposable element Tcb2 transposase [Trichonephila clavipes]
MEAGWSARRVARQLGRSDCVPSGMSITSCNHVLPLMQQLPGIIFQQDIARPHTGRMSQDCLRTVTTLPRPARSPDLSPIEHIWDHLG